MVCIYCGHETQVINSRLQKRLNQVWRRRKCLECGNTFTTHERPDYSQSFVFKGQTGKLSPFERDKLLLSVYGSCSHRAAAQTDATALTNTILSKLQAKQENGVIDRSILITTTLAVLKRFDMAAYVHYGAHHRS